MTTEQLLIPRYKVLSLWPACESLGFNKVGDILTDNSKDAVMNQDGDAVVPIEWELFPVLFRKLEWWEDRRTEDMPMYVRCLKSPDQIITPGSVLKVVWAEQGGKVENGPWIFPYTNCYEPATEKEYLNYINSKK